MSGLAGIFFGLSKNGAVATLSLLTLVGLSLPAEAYCAIPPIRSVNNFARGSMLVTSGESCSAYYNSEKPTHAMQVAVRPKNGTVVLGIASVTYTSRRGFVGKDSFTMVLHGTNHLGRQLRSTTVFDVTVAAVGH